MGKPFSYLVAALAAGSLIGADSGYHWDLPRGFPTPRVPVDNPMSEAKVRLGRYLFYDTRLSVTSDESCASCHKQELAFTDGRATALGATGESHSRSAMSLVNVAYSSVLTWSDPNQRTLEKQALVPMLGEHPVELGLTGHADSVLTILREDPIYSELVPKVFPRDGLTLPNIAKALAAFERTIISARSPWDRFHFLNDQSAISESAKRGEVVFFSDEIGGCFRCHAGFNFSDSAFHNTGLYDPYPAPNVGIYEHTHLSADLGKFKTPSLRNVELTAPYMHDGSIATLERVIDHYSAGGRAHGNPHLDPRMLPRPLSAQNRADLVAFLKSLTDADLLRDPRWSDPWHGSLPVSHQLLH